MLQEVIIRLATRKKFNGMYREYWIAIWRGCGVIEKQVRA